MAASSRCRYLLLIVLAYAATFRLVVLDRPFHYDDEATGGAFYGIMARNYLRFPWTETHGMPVVTVGRLAGTPLVFYADHSPLVPLLIAPVYKVFGVGEWQTRLPTSIATVLAICVLYVLVKRSGTQRASLVAASLFAAMPMSLYFGGQPEVLGMPLVLFALLTLFAYLHFQREPRLPAFALLIGSFTLAAVTDWPAFILVPVLVAHFAATRPRRMWPWMLALSAYASAIFTLLYVYIALAANLPWRWMVPLLEGRAAIGAKASFTAREWFHLVWLYNEHHHTLPLLAATGLWLILYGVRVRAAQPGRTVAGLLLAWGALHVLIGRQGVYNHEWWWWPLTPGIAVASALLVDGMLAAWERRGWSRLPNAVATIAIVLFAGWTADRAYRELYRSHRDDPFTTLELGQTIRAAAPGPNDLAMLAWSADDPELWFYGDRPLRGDIWTIDDFRERQSGLYADLVFGDQQPWPAPAAGLVFPVICRRTLPDLHAYVAARYPLVPLPPGVAEKFEVFDLRRTER
jgi:4-amino-4-deoxy-L-arabinose transferase-like glycosyltransferase